MKSFFFGKLSAFLLCVLFQNAMKLDDSKLSGFLLSFRCLSYIAHTSSQNPTIQARCTIKYSWEYKRKILSKWLWERDNRIRPLLSHSKSWHTRIAFGMGGNILLRIRIDTLWDNNKWYYEDNSATGKTFVTIKYNIMKHIKISLVSHSFELY